MPTHEGGAEQAPQTKTLSAREELIARMSARVNEERAAEMAAAAPKEPAIEPATVPIVEDPEPEPVDPFAEFGVVIDGKAMVKLKVDGKEELMPLETARATLQKHEAADRRLQQAAEQAKDLQRREAALQAREAEVLAKLSKPVSHPPEDADDPDLDEEMKQVAHSILNSTEDEIAATLKKVLTRRQATPAVDVDEIVSKAAQTAEQRVVERSRAEGVAQGWQQFQATYPDIASDPRLFAVADKMTDDIAAEHPEWAPAQVMLESGKRTKEWVASFAPAPEPKPSDRQKAKEQLRPMPQSRTGRVPAAEPEKPKTHADILAEVRKARGQTV